MTTTPELAQLFASELSQQSSTGFEKELTIKSPQEWLNGTILELGIETALEWNELERES